MGRSTPSFLPRMYLGVSNPRRNQVRRVRSLKRVEVRGRLKLTPFSFLVPVGVGIGSSWNDLDRDHDWRVGRDRTVSPRLGLGGSGSN